MESRIIKFNPLDDQSRLNGSHKVGDLDLSFEKLIGTFGEPNLGSDGYKTDVEWGIELDDGTIASIYNYKNHDIVIPLKVLDEIDKHKKRQVKSYNRQGRKQ